MPGDPLDEALDRALGGPVVPAGGRGGAVDLDSALDATLGIAAAAAPARPEPAVTGDPLADAQAFAAAGNRDNMDVEEAWGEFAKREPYVGPQEMEQTRKEFPFTGDTAREYLARVRGEDERVRLRREAAERSREPGFLEKAGQVVTRIPGAAAELASKMLPTADPTQVGRKRDVRVDPDALAAHALEGFGAISPEERDAAVGRGVATRERMSRQLGWSLANAGAQATGEMAVAGPMFRAFGPGKTMAGMGAASDTENPARGAAVGLFTGKAGTWAAKYLQGTSGNRLRAALAEGFGFTEADFVAGEADALVSGDPRRRRTAEQSLAAFTTGVGQRLLQANPKATEADFQKAVEAEVQARMGGDATPDLAPDGRAIVERGSVKPVEPAKPSEEFIRGVEDDLRAKGFQGDVRAEAVRWSNEQYARWAAPPKAADAAQPIKGGNRFARLLEKYEVGEGDLQVSDLVERVDSLGSRAPQGLQDAVARYKREMREHREVLGERGDAETIEADFLGALRRAGGAPEVKTAEAATRPQEGRTEADPAERAASDKRLGGERGAAVIPDLSGAADAAGGAAETGSAVLEAGKALLGPVGQRTRGLGPAGDRLADTEIRADVATKDYRAKVSADEQALKEAAQGDAPLAGVRKKLGFGSGGAKRMAADRAQEVGTERPEYGDSVGTDWVERDAPARTPEEQAIKDARKRFLGSTWNAQADLGFTRRGTDITGWDGDVAVSGAAEVPMQRIADGMGRTVPSQNNELGREIVLTGEAHPRWKDWVAGHRAKMLDRHPDAPDETIAGIEKRLLQESADAREGRIVGSEGHMASEFARDLERPDFIRNSETGKLEPVHVVNVYRHTDAMMTAGAQTVGAQVALGRGSKSQVDAIRGDILKEAGEGAAPTADRALRSIFGMKPTKPVLDAKLAKLTAEGSAPSKALRAYDALGNWIRTGIRTGSWTWQAPDIAFGNNAVLMGAANTARGVYQTLKNITSVGLGHGRTAKADEMIASGRKTPNVPDWSRDLHREMLPALNRAQRAVAEITARTADEFQESTAAHSSDPFVQQLQENLGTYGAVARNRLAIRLQAFADVPRAEGDAWLRGELSPERSAEIVKQIEERGVARSIGSNVANSQRSLLDQSPAMARVFTFYKWFSNNTATTSRFFRAAADTLKAAESAPTRGEAWKMRGAAAAEGTRFLAYKALNGALAQMLSAAILPGGGPGDEMEKMRENPVRYFLSAAFFNSMGGSVTNVVTGGGLKLRNTLPGRVYGAFIETPVGAGVETWKGGVGAGGDRLGEGMERYIPVTRAATRGSFSEPAPTGISTKPKKPRKTK